MNKLTIIQNKLKVPKDRHNDFANFDYRNADAIMEKVKPLLLEYGCELYLTEEIVFIGNRYYVKSIAHFSDGENKKDVPGHGRESEIKKGMDSAQITGSTSSYAKKYALGNLFLLDDSKDIDSMDNKLNIDNLIDKIIEIMAERAETLTIDEKNRLDLIMKNKDIKGMQNAIKHFNGGK